MHKFDHFFHLQTNKTLMQLRHIWFCINCLQAVDTVSFKVCLSVWVSVWLSYGRRLPGHVPEGGPHPFKTQTKAQTTNPLLGRRSGVGGPWRQAAVSSRLNNPRPCSSAESHALQLRVLAARQRFEGQGSRQGGGLKSLGMLMSCSVFCFGFFLLVEPGTIGLLFWLTIWLQVSQINVNLVARWI